MKSNHDFTTPLSRVRGLGSARNGTQHFFMQRLTAVANVPLSLFFVYFLTKMLQFGENYGLMEAFVSRPLNAIALIFLLISFTYHMRLGMQIIIEDYVHGEGAKVLLIIANTLFTLLLALAGIFAILKISFGV